MGYITVTSSSLHITNISVDISYEGNKYELAFNCKGSNVQANSYRINRARSNQSNNNNNIQSQLQDVNMMLLVSNVYRKKQQRDLVPGVQHLRNIVELVAGN